MYLFSDKYNSETAYNIGLHKNLSLNERYPDNPYRGKNLCSKCYREVYEPTPEPPVENHFADKPAGSVRLQYSVTKVKEYRRAVIVAQILLGALGLLLLSMFGTFSNQWNVSGQLSQLSPAEDLLFAGFCFIAVILLCSFARYDNIIGLEPISNI